MADKPILFSGWKVRAIYAGADVARRPMNPQPGGGFFAVGSRLMFGYRHGAVWFCSHTPGESRWHHPRCHKGDILYVKEAWRTTEEYDHLPPRDIPRDAVIEYLATDVPFVLGRYRHARFMCRWMARLWLRVPGEPTPERVRDITEAEAIREGCHFGRCEHSCGSDDWPELHQSAVDEFMCVWSRLHGPDSWERDWDWRYAFERTEAPHG